MIDATRFIADKATDEDAWLRARAQGITATTVAKASTEAGFREVVAERANPQPVEKNAYMQFGTDNENWIALCLKREFGIMPCSWVIASEDNPLYLASPDGLTLDHLTVGEIKTGGTIPKSVPMQHRRQVNWQFACTGAEHAKYAFVRRIEVNGIYVPESMDPIIFDIDRDDALIEQLKYTAELLLVDHESRRAA